MTLASQGRSASALVGALFGNGLVTLERARVSGLDPRMFDAALAASDGGQALNDDRLRQIVEHSLSAGPLAIASAQIPFNVRDGRLRVGATTLDGEGAKAIVSGGYDIAADQVDIRASLASTSAGSANNRPEIQIFAVGPPSAINRTIDVTSLSSWLAVRAIDRETRRLDSIEQRMAPPLAPQAAPPPPATASFPAAAPPDVSATPVPKDNPPVADVPVPSRDPRRPPAKPKAAVQSHPQPVNTPAPPAAAPLPAPVEIRPAPRPKPVRPHQPLVLTPPASDASRPAL
jgi:large subunit ribosomal protein L24